MYDYDKEFIYQGKTIDRETPVLLLIVTINYVICGQKFIYYPRKKIC